MFPALDLLRTIHILLLTTHNLDDLSVDGLSVDDISADDLSEV